MHGVPDRYGAADRPSRSVESGEKTVTRSVYLLPSEALQFSPDQRSVVLQEGSPSAIAEDRGPLRRADDVGERDCRKDPVRLGRRPHSGKKLLDLVDDRVSVTKVRKVVYARELHVSKYLDGSMRVIRDYSYRPTQLAGPGYFLLGDAAAFVDPIFSVGVVLAMYSAYLATWAIDRSMKRPAQTAQNRTVFSSQFLGRLEVARSLVLPRYTSSHGVSDLAKQSIQLESSLEQELMYVVSTVTTRNENFMEMAEKTDGQKISSGRYQVLEEIISRVSM